MLEGYCFPLWHLYIRRLGRNKINKINYHYLNNSNNANSAFWPQRLRRAVRAVDIIEWCASLSFQNLLACQSHTVFHGTSFVNGFHWKDCGEYIASIKSLKNIVFCLLEVLRFVLIFPFLSLKIFILSNILKWVIVLLYCNKNSGSGLWTDCNPLMSLGDGYQWKEIWYATSHTYYSVLWCYKLLKIEYSPHWLKQILLLHS